jgi:hypothetical protein
MDGERASPRTVICTAEEEGLTRVLSAGDVKADPREALWEAYHAVFRERESWTVIIIIHLLGLAPAGYLASSDSGP